MYSQELKRVCQEILKSGRQRFDAMMGIVSCIRDSQYEIVAVSSDTDIPRAGDTYALESVYCREVVEKKCTLAITEIDGVPGMSLHPLYSTIPCEFYISSPIMVDGRVWGTLNFTSLGKRDTPFSPTDIAFNEANALDIARALR